MIPLPLDFRDRSFLARRWADVLLLTHRRSIKAVCCESFRNPAKLRACKGCATLYSKDSPNPWYRFIARHAKVKLSTPTPAPANPSENTPKPSR